MDLYVISFILERKIKHLEFYKKFGLYPKFLERSINVPIGK